MVGTSARLLRLLSLLQARRSWTGAELTSRLEVTPRTLRRDVDRLRTLGYPVASAAGVGGGYSFGAGTDLPPLLLDDREALAVALGLRAAAAGAIAGLEDATLGALAKLDQVMPARLRRRVSALHGAIVPLPHRGPAVDVATLSVLAGACRDAERLRFEYQGRDTASRPGRGLTRRRVEPAGLVSAGFRWYLVAWDLDRADWRTFRVDRIAGKPARGETFAPRPPPPGGLSAYVAKSVSTDGYGVRARVRLHAPLAEMAPKFSASAGTLESTGPDTCVLTTGAPSVEGLAAWMAMLGVDFEILDPPGAAAALRDLTRRIGRAARASTARRRRGGLAPPSPPVRH
ncbi:MAG TPA: WYL domain-containing protein [Polyangia bacterium]|nr:WYL domain-containing protein [Polyangia bacterium]